MAHIFKYPEGGNKGILVLTHKELKWLQFNFRKKEIFNPYLLISKKFQSRKVKTYINHIKEKYFIGIHWGHFHENVVTPDWVSFHMSALGTCTFVGDPIVIPLSSANFTPRIMAPKRIDKYWDIITVAKNIKVKRFDILINEIRKIFDLGYKYRVLFVIASNKVEHQDKFYSNILDDYFELFSDEERERFTIIKTHPNMGFQGFSYTFLAHLYNQSKIFTIFSQQEGECRVIKEAQMCGLPIVVKSDMIGGGRDYLNSNNSVLFNEYSEAHHALIEAVETVEKFEVDFEQLKEVLGEKASIESLKKYFSDLYKSNDQEFDGSLVNLDNLNRRLPSHYFDASIVWANHPKYRFSTTDVVTLDMFRKLYSSLF